MGQRLSRSSPEQPRSYLLSLRLSLRRSKRRSKAHKPPLPLYVEPPSPLSINSSSNITDPTMIFAPRVCRGTIEGKRAGSESLSGEAKLISQKTVWLGVGRMGGGTANSASKSLAAVRRRLVISRVHPTAGARQHRPDREFCHHLKSMHTRLRHNNVDECRTMLCVGVHWQKLCVGLNSGQATPLLSLHCSVEYHASQ